MRGHQPVHPAAYVPSLRGQRQVEVIGHQAIGKNAHRSANTRLRHQVEERVVIVGFMKHRRPCVPPIEDVIGVSG